jgi:hypothetical protein
LVYISLFPVLADWANLHSQQYSLDTLTESKAHDLYNHVVQSICSSVKLPESTLEKFYNLHSSDDEDASSSSEDDPISIHTQLRPSLRSDHFASQRSARHHVYDSSSDEETSYPPKKVESAAERLGETRRKGEHSDLDDAVSYAYIGFSNRALVLLNSLIRYGNINFGLINYREHV